MLNLDKLNTIQRNAVEIIQGPLLILAGAGSGKTRVITYRIVHLMEEYKINSNRILAVTFTNKAAQEMKARVISLLDGKNDCPLVSTFHSLCVRLLRSAAETVGYKQNFVIYSDYEQDKLVKEIYKKINIDDKFLPLSRVMAKISRAKNDLINAEEFSKKNIGDIYLEKIGEIYIQYQKKLKENNAMDFDDLIMLTVIALEKNENIRNYYQDRFQYIMVDEYQDTNMAQYRLLKILSEKHKNICVVGDDDQSIYEWRGANIANILNFEKDFHGAKIIRMEQNYRSTKTILEAANAVIQNNKMRKGKRLWTGNADGSKIVHFLGQNEIDEARFVAKTIIQFTKEKNKKWGDFAVFYRTHAQSRIIEDSLRNENMPYAIIGGIKFYDRKEIKDILAYLKVISNSDDSISLKRIVNIPRRGIGDTTLDYIDDFANKNSISLFDAMKRAFEIDAISQRAKKTISGFIAMMENYINVKDKTPVSSLLNSLIGEIQYIEEIQNEEDAEARIQNIQELVSAAMEYEDSAPPGLLEGFLEKVSLVASIDNLPSDSSGQVVLMTLHNAKGLEFPVVFIVGLEDGIFPHGRSFIDDREMEEERRLCYVGITRAEEHLYLCSTERRTIYGSETRNPPSRFLEEIPSEFISSSLLSARSDNNTDDDDNSESYSKNIQAKEVSYIEETPEQNNFKIGQRIYHKTWGEGIIKNIYGEDAEVKALLYFNKFGLKKILLRYAKLIKI
ncbi:UvrD-helicase domain-containing protein [Candidatus Poribacteria bacterium]|nr:UvrD-helicase domain-containing protein [Candidatus Poribacteria bacterium]